MKSAACRVAVLAVLCTIQLPAAAQDDEVDTITLPDEGREQPRKPPARVLEEIVVTAQKTQQSLQDVPVAVSVVNAEQLRNSGVFGPEGIENFVPNVELDMDAQSPTISIRGFSTDTYNVGLEPSVGIIIDEIPISRTEFIPDGLFDVARVEVLRGPQGTLFGKNTIAGVLIFGSRDPAPESAGNVIVTGGEQGERRIEAGVDLPFSDTFYARGSAVSWRDPGEVENNFLDRTELKSRQDAGRLRFTWDAGERLSLRFGGQYSDSFVNYSPWQLYDLDPDALDYAQSKDPETEDDPFDAHTTFDLPGFVERKTHIAHLIADYELTDWLQMTLIGGTAGADNELLMDFDVSAADLVIVDVDPNFGQDSLELRFTGGREFFGRWVDVVGGLFAFHADLDINVDIALGDDIAEFGASPAGMEALGAPQGLPLPPIPVPQPEGAINDGLNQTFVQDALALAAFGQATIALTERLSVIAGLRVGQEEKDATLTVVTRPQPEQASVTATIVGGENFTRELKRDESEVSPKLGLLFDINDDLSTYASWTRGFKSGGFNGISFADENEGDAFTDAKKLEFEPERGDNYELGFKARLAGGAMRLNATVYRTDISNMQVTSFNGISFDVFNAAEARLQGFEADLSWLTPLDWLSVNASLAIASAEYRSYPDAPASAENDDGSGEQDLSGRTLPKAPKMTASLNPVISLPLGENFGAQLGVDLAWRGDQYLEVDLDSHSFQKAHLLVGSFINIGPDHERWGFTLRGENLTDKKALAFVSDHNLYANSYFAAQIPLRRFSASFVFNW